MNATTAQIEKAMVKVKMLKAVRKCNRSDFKVTAEKNTDESKVQGSKVWKSHPRNVYSHDCSDNVLFMLAKHRCEEDHLSIVCTKDVMIRHRA